MICMINTCNTGIYRDGLENERRDTQAFDGLVAISVRAVSEPLYRCLSQKIDTSIPK